MTLASNPEGGSGAPQGHEGVLAGQARGFPCAGGQKSRDEMEKGKRKPTSPWEGPGYWEEREEVSVGTFQS